MLKKQKNLEKKTLRSIFSVREQAKVQCTKVLGKATV